jgi:hypothetical protein
MLGCENGCERLAGVCFILPAMLVPGIAWFYQQCSSMPQVSGSFMGANRLL